MEASTPTAVAWPARDVSGGAGGIRTGGWRERDSE